VKSLLTQLASRPFQNGSEAKTRPSRTRLAAFCAVVFLTTAGVRLLYWQDNSVDISRGKMWSGHLMLTFFYHDQAQKMLEDGMLFPSKAPEGGDTSILTHPPGYSMLIVALYKMFYAQDGNLMLSRANTALRIVQIVCDALSSVVVVLIAAEFFPIAMAFIAGLLTSLSPHFAYYSILLSPDTLAVLPILLAFYCLLRARRRPRLIEAIAAGVLVGLSCWLRPNALLLAPLLVIVILLFFERGKRLRSSLALVCAAWLTVAPVIIRNWVIFHRFIPLSATAGLLLVEGIGDYDKDRRFGMPANDTEAGPKDAEWHGRPDYADNLWKPDGLERDHARLTRGIAVIRSNPGWFLGVMLRRMWFMLRYNDLRPQQLDSLTVAPTLAEGPNFAHHLEVPDGATPVWSSPPAELAAQGAVVAGRAQVSTDENLTALEITTDGSHRGDLFFSEPIAVKPNTDYMLRLRVRMELGFVNVKIGTSDPRVVLALVSSSNAVRERKSKTLGQKSNDLSGVEQPMKILLVPFASGHNTSVRVSLYKSTDEPAIVKLGGAEMFDSGLTPYLWTRLPRAVIRAIQKNFFKTEVARALIVIGAVLLVCAGRSRALAALAIVPLYFLCCQSVLHTEYRYILAIHYFLFVIAAATIYVAGFEGARVLMGIYGLARRKRGADH